MCVSFRSVISEFISNDFNKIFAVPQARCCIDAKGKAPYYFCVIRLAVITGASSGFGSVYAKLIDRRKDIDEIWLVARREDRLLALSSELSHPVLVLPLDLTKPASIDRLKTAFESKAKRSPFDEIALSSAAEKRGGNGMTIAFFVNCAGAGKIGDYCAIAREDNERMIALNCTAFVNAALTSLPYMERGSRIINVSSTSAFQPFQHLAVYAATKAFVLSWSRALRWELFPRGIRVTAVCPYWMKKTEFIKNAESGVSRSSRPIRNFHFGDDPVVAAHLSLWASALNLPVVTTGAVSTLHRIIAKMIPREIMQALWEIWRLL